MEGGGFEPAAPYSNIGGGEFFSQELGTLLRLRYNTRSYGQNEEGNLDIGTMQVVNFSDAIGFFDGQLTLNDANGPGYNLGLGFRWLDYVPFVLESERITGVSIWADGTHTEAGNFFPQVGVTYESLGDMWDLRVNGYVPLGPRSQLGKFEPTGETGFLGNNISELTQATRDTSLDVAELELARRLWSERDAWAFGGGYVLNNGDQDAAGYRLGLRGYAYPDLMLQIAVSDDDLFKTNAAFTLIWFVGRTRSDYQPTCGLPDRFREPVLRNDYVALTKEVANDGIPINGPDGDPLRVVHVNSAAPDGGDGTFENPLNNLAEINGNSQDGDIVLAWSESVFDMQNAAVLQDNQRFWGEGDGVSFGVATQDMGTIQLPETSPGARDRARPIILDALGSSVVTLADANEVVNFTIDGGTNGIVAGADGAGSPIISTMSIFNLTGDGIVLTPFVRENGTNETVAFSVNISDVDFDNVAGTDIDLNADTTAAVGSPGVTLNEAIVIRNVTSTNNGSMGINLQNTHTGGTVMLTNWSYTDGIDALRLNNFDSALTMTTSTVMDNAGFGVNILGESDGSFTFNGTNTWDNLGGIVFDVSGTFTGTISMQDDIENSTDFSVRIQGMDDDASITFTGDITDTGSGIRVMDNDDGAVLFGGDLDLDTTTSAAVSVTNNADAAITFAGLVDIETTSGNGFVATGGGTLGVSGNANTITTTGGGTGLTITDMTIATGGANFADLNVAAGAVNAIFLEENTGGPITVGLTSDEIGEAGLITGTSGDAIVITNSDNVTITGLRINNTAAVSGVRVTKNTTGTQITNLNDLEINDGDIGVEVVGNGDGSLSMTLNDSNINDSTAFGFSVSDIDAGTTSVARTTFDGENNVAGGVLIADSDATFNFDSNSVVENYGGIAFEVDGGEANVNMNGTITNTAGRSIVVEDHSGGTVTFNGDINDSGTGILIQANTGGTVNVTGDTTLTTGANDAVTVDNNDGSNVNFASLDITTTSGDGFVATGGGTLGVSGTTNTITTTTGTGLTISDMTIAAGGVNFQSVTVNGAANGIVIDDTTGGTITVGNQSGAQNSGGSLTTTGNAIDISNAQNVVLNHVRVINSGGQGVAINHDNNADSTMSVTIRDMNLDNSTGSGIGVSADGEETFSLQILASDLEENVDIAATGSGQFNLNVDDTEITLAVGNAEEAFNLQFSGAATSGDVTFSDNNFMADTESALVIGSSGSGAAKSLRILIADSEFTANGTEAAVDIDSGGNTLMQLTVRGNMFDSAGATNDLEIDSNGTATSRLRLNLGGEDPDEFNTPVGTGMMQLQENGTSVFGVFELAETDLDNRNNGTVIFLPNVGAFDNLATEPALPNFP